MVLTGFMIGPYDHTFQLGRFIRDFQAGKTVFAPPGTASFCDVRAVTDGVVTAAEKGRTRERYNLTGYNRGYAEVLTRMGEIVGAWRKPVRLPAEALRAYGALGQFGARFTGRPPAMDPRLARYLCVPQASIWAKARDELGYHPRDIDQAIRDAADWYDQHMPWK